ncbi:hypothetical protein QBC42DRAFT_190428 [Cladorrhinum samala]|uniref:RING-type E3 ubiquitin transferase n=1 Tax=Cladorrhinum samala TaxID=585594 RepID=A0AAV9H8A8_9PEZI|nr:hypothetical protein QBC42DRAFT_190428 [Cladorrhinum samala]
MYCHACHHSWEREGDSIQCPQCQSSSTEMITPEHDPRVFHNPPQEQPATTTTDSDPMDIDTTPVTPAAAPTAVPQEQTQSTSSQTTAESTSPNDNNSTPNSNDSDGNNGSTAQGRSQIRFTAVSFPTGVTLITTVVGDTPPPQLIPGPIPIPFFGWHFMHTQASSNAASQENENTQAAADGQNEQQSQPQEQPSEQQPADARPQPQPPRQAQMMEALLTMLFNPASAIMGDAVYSQEAFDRVMTMLRNQTPVGGAPPASQAAIDKLPVKELTEDMLGSDGTCKCVVCVEDMVKGEKATVLPCNHFFHGECVTPWLKEHNTCPVCRHSVETEEEPIKNKMRQFGPELPPEMRHGQDQDNSMDCS